MKSPDFLVDISIATGSEPNCAPKINPVTPSAQGPLRGLPVHFARHTGKRGPEHCHGPTGIPSASMQANSDFEITRLKGMHWRTCTRICQDLWNCRHRVLVVNLLWMSSDSLRRSAFEYRHSTNVSQLCSACATPAPITANHCLHHKRLLASPHQRP